MLETPHVLVGAAIATKVTNPALSIPLALASHFILDRVPHWNPHTYTETKKFGKPLKKTVQVALTDIVLSFVIGLSIAYLALPNTTQALNIILVCFASVLPDVTKYPFFLFKNTRKGLYKKWVDFERSLQITAEFTPGIFNQLLIIIAAVFWMTS